MSLITGLAFGYVTFNVVINALRPTIPPWVPEFWRALMKTAWDADPHKRPTFSDILKLLNGLRGVSQFDSNLPVLQKQFKDAVSGIVCC